MLDKIKEFGPSSWAIDNRTSIYIIAIILTLAGIVKYNNLPKEQFPDVVVPNILVNTIYPGTSPEDMESLVTKPLEKQLKSITGVKKIESNSVQDFSMVNLEFNTDVNVQVAKQKVKDAVDKAIAQRELPNDLPSAPSVMDIDFSQMPIMFLHISGDYDLAKLKKFAEVLQDKIEEQKEITRVDIVGALEREVQINVDLYRMQAAGVTLSDIERAVSFENLTVSGGTIDLGNTKRSISVKGQYKNPRLIEELVIRSSTGASVQIKDIAEVLDGYKEKESYARLDHKNVITLNIVKKGGQNLINASDKVRAIAKELQETTFPKGLKITITGDQSEQTRVTLHDLINTIIIGFILVVLILMFFMGTTNAIFVGLSVPLSMCLAFLVEPAFFDIFLARGFSLNMIVLFAFLLALGIVVDDAIVVIENTHRIFDNGKVPIAKAAKLAAGEVFIPVLSGTLTTLAPFFPLAFWDGVIGGFMFFLPITMIITLFASLIVAYIFNPVFAVSFMKAHTEAQSKPTMDRGFKITSLVFVAIILVLFATFGKGMGNLGITLYILYVLEKFFLHHVIVKFQNKIWPGIQDKYARMMEILLKGKRAILLVIGTFILFILSIVLIIFFAPNVVFFPQSEPNFVYTYIKLPVGTDQVYTDSITRVVENKIFDVVGENNPIVESIISNVAVGTADAQSNDNSVKPNMGKVSVAFVKFAKRNGQSTAVYLDKIRAAIKGVPGAEISVDKENNGPPVQKPISIELSGDDFTQLTNTATELKRFIQTKNISGIEELKSDLDLNKPEIVINIDRIRANREGISTGQVGMTIRNAVFGKEVSKFKDNNDEIPIQLRFKADQRNDVTALLNQKIIFRDMNMGGMVREVPLSSVADVSYGNTFGGIKRKNLKRVVTISSNVLNGFNPNNVVGEVQQALTGFKSPIGISISFGGEQEQQKETGAFLGWAMMVALGLIFLILVTQFNSFSKPMIILSEILFSLIGVFLGFIIFRMEMSIVMTGIGVVALAGIVVRNGILLVEFTDILRAQGMPLRQALVEAGRTRMTPVILTASATILGLVPLAIGLNMDFVKLFETGNPHIFIGGDSVAFWGPLSWTMIFGLSFATLLTLIIVPAMMLITETFKNRYIKKKTEPIAAQ
jgi:multidrug efflux pump